MLYCMLESYVLYVTIVNQLICTSTLFKLSRTRVIPTDLQHLCCKSLINKLTSIWFHMGYFKITSHPLEFLGYIYMNLTRRKHPDHLADSCKRSSINRMAADSRLPRSSHGFFCPFSTFSNTLSVTTLKQAVGSGFLQTFSTCAVKP